MRCGYLNAGESTVTARETLSLQPVSSPIVLYKKVFLGRSGIFNNYVDGTIGRDWLTSTINMLTYYNQALMYSTNLKGRYSALPIYHGLFSPNNPRDAHSSPVKTRYGCLPWDPSLTEVLPSNLVHCVRHRVVWYRDIWKVYSIRFSFIHQFYNNLALFRIMKVEWYHRNEMNPSWIKKTCCI